MPEMRLQSVVSASESEERHRPENLLAAKSSWRGKAGAESNSVILKLAKEEEIRTIFVGNDGSAYISVAVAKSCDVLPSFNILIPETAFMDPGECRLEKNLQRVKSFDATKMTAAFQQKKWDLVKVVCKQPYNKRLPFGISFISLIGGDEETAIETASSPQLTRLGLPKPATPSTRTFFDEMATQVRKHEERSVEMEREQAERAERIQKNREALAEKARTMRAKRRLEDEATPSCSSSTAIILDSKGRPINSNSTPKQQQMEQSPKRTDNSGGASFTPSRILQSMINANNTTSSSEELKTVGEKKDRKVFLNITPKRRRAEQQEENEGLDSPPPSAPPRRDPEEPTTSAERPRSQKPAREPLSGVVFSLSGFENPLRGQLREKGCELGAVYSQDICPELTHLVCAFKNTPKARKVRQPVRIVSKYWIERCDAEKRRLNEDLFKL